MKIINYILALSFVCCAATTPIKAETISSELIKEIMKGNDSKASPVMYQMAIGFAEKKIKREIQKQQKTKRRALERIEDYQNELKEIAAGTHWACDYNGPEYLAEYKLSYEEDIQKYLEKIPQYDEKITQFEALLAEVQAMK